MKKKYIYIFVNMNKNDNNRTSRCIVVDHNMNYKYDLKINV